MGSHTLYSLPNPTPMKTHHLFLLFAAVAVAGCDREEPGLEGYITGQLVSVMDRTTPVPDAKVVIYRADGCNSTGNPACWEALDSSFSDQNGWFATSYRAQGRSDVLFAKGYKDGYIERADATIFRMGSDTITSLMTPKNYFRVHIKDEYPYDYSKYVGMQVYNTSLIPIDTIFQYPLDTTVIIEGNPTPLGDGTPRGMAYSLIYDRPNTVGSNNYLRMDACAPFDTCDVEIRF